MTIGEWLASRAPAAPPLLAARLRELLGAAANDDARYASERCLAIAEATVTGLLREGRIGRESANDLLAADALVTYAFEAAGDDPAKLDDFVHAAMLRLGRMGAVEVGPARRAAQADSSAS
jgi:hypothetical protein